MRNEPEETIAQPPTTPKPPNRKEKILFFTRDKVDF
jgi:hypothetical protein